MTDRKVLLRYSKDGGHTWSNWRQRSLGAMGEYERRVQFLRNGRYRQLVVRIRVSSPVKRDLLGAVAVIEPTEG